MRHEQIIIDAFKSSGIRRILLIDDVYDPPEINRDALVDFLENADNRTALLECAIEERTIKEAIDSAADSEVSEQLDSIHQSLYQKFIDTKEERFDPGGKFEEDKGVALDILRPLRALLNKFGDEIEVCIAGSLDEGKKRCAQFAPQALFIDYYLSPDVQPTGALSVDRAINAVERSVAFLQPIIKNADRKDIPAIVLMSSRPPSIEDRDKYRHRVGCMSLAFPMPEERVGATGW